MPLGLVADVAMQSSLAEATHGFACGDFIWAVAPFAVRDVYEDRGQALNKHGSETREVSIWLTARERLLPGIIFNSTVVERGKRLAFSTVACDPSILSDLKSFPGFHEFDNLYPQIDILISTAVRLSSTFMFVSPAARPLCTTELVPRKDVRPVTRRAALGDLNLYMVDGGRQPLRYRGT